MEKFWYLLGTVLFLVILLVVKYIAGFEGAVIVGIALILGGVSMISYDIDHLK